MLQSFLHLTQAVIGQTPDAVESAVSTTTEAAAPATEATQSMMSYMTEGGPVVIGVLLLLAVMSFMSWVLIAMKWQQIGRAARQSKGFAKDFGHVGVTRPIGSLDPLAHRPLVS